MLFLQCILLVGVSSGQAWGAFSQLFPVDAAYEFLFNAESGAGFVRPTMARTRHALSGVLRVVRQPERQQLYLQLSKIRHSLWASEEGGDEASGTSRPLPSTAAVLQQPFMLDANLDLNFTAEDVLWSINMKRAIAAAFVFNTRGHNLPGAFKTKEPCLHGPECLVEYSSADGQLIRRSHQIPTLVPSDSHRLWVSVMPNICTKDTKNPLIGSAERWYYLDEQGLQELKTVGSIEIHYHKHIYESLTNFTLIRAGMHNLTEEDRLSVELPQRVGLPWRAPPSEDHSGGRATQPPADKEKALLYVLLRAARGLEIHGPRDTLLRDQLPLEIHRIMATLSYESLKRVHEELELGTSYTRETMKNIFIEALPQSKTRASAILVRDLVQSKRAGDSSAALQLLRKLPFSLEELGAELLGELETLFKLGQEHPPGVRSAGILCFSTIVFKTFLSGACTSDTFEEYVQTYFSRFTESPDYADRLVWLMGLSNLQLEHVTTYLAPVIAGGLGHSSHERFLAVWNTMPMARQYPTEVHATYWPILQDVQEPLELRIAAATMLLHAEPYPHRLLSLHWYISAQPSNQLKNYFYTTVRSMEHTTFDCYKHLQKLSSYLSKLVRSPGSRYWATGNYLVDAADASRDMGVMFQTFSIADPMTGLPDILYFTLLAHNAGLIVQDCAIYLKLQGIASSFLSKLHRLSGESLRIEDLFHVLKELHANVRIPQRVHGELILKHQQKAVMVIHINQTTFDKWTDGDIMKTINSLLQAESHVNQQMLVYPLLLSSILPSEIGTPIQTDTVLASLTSLRGNLTHAIGPDEIARKNDVHFRSSSLALLGLTAYNPVADTRHVAEVAQVTDLYLPANFTLAVSIADMSLKSSWLQPAGSDAPGVSASSGLKVTIRKGGSLAAADLCPECKADLALGSQDNKIAPSILETSLKCDGISSAPEVIWQVLTSHTTNTNAVPLARPLLLLLHVLALGSLPAEGACQAAVAHAPYSLEHAVRTDSDMYISPSATSVLLHANILRRSGPDDQVVFRFNSTYRLEYSKKEARLLASIQLQEKDHPRWKLCMNADNRLSMYEKGRTGHVLFLRYGEAAGDQTCPNSSSLILSMEPRHKPERAVDFTFKSSNLPKLVQSMANRVKSLLELLGESAETQAGSLVAGQLGQLYANLSGSVQLRADHQRWLAVETDRGHAEVQLGDALGRWAFPFSNEERLPRVFKDLGILRECSVSVDMLTDVYGGEQQVMSTCPLLLFGDCTPKPSFAFTKLPSNSNLVVRLYTGGNYAEVEGSSVKINDKAVKMENGVYTYPESEAFYDFKVTQDSDGLTVDSRVGEVQLHVKDNVATLLVPATHLTRGCGLCFRQDQNFFRC